MVDKIEGVIKRENVVEFVDTNGNSGTPNYEIANKGILSLSGSLNTETDEYQYIADKNKTTVAKGMKPTYSGECHRYNGDPANDFFYKIGEQQKLNQKTSIVRADLANPTVEGSTVVHAIRRNVNIIVNDFDSGAGGEPLGFTFDLTQEGDIENGTFDVNTKVFTPDEE